MCVCLAIAALAVGRGWRMGGGGGKGAGSTDVISEASVGRVCCFVLVRAARA